MDNNEFPEIIIDVLKRGEIGVLRRLAKKNKSEVIRLRPLERFGFSGAKLYEAFFTRNRKGLPFVVKVHKNKKIRDEIESSLAVQHFFEDCLISQGLQSAFTANHGAVAYKQFTCGKHKGQNRIIELKDLIERPSTLSSDLDKLLRQVYKISCGKAHGAAELKPIVLRSEYDRYFRDDLARPRIKLALGEQSSENMCIVLGTEVANPLRVLAKGFRRKLDCVVGPVHGDLHPSNVILDKNEVPHLIDFRWAERRGHILKDYVLLENSMRFMNFPKHISQADQLKIDKALLQEKGYEDIGGMDFSSPEAKRRFRRLSKSVGAIRVAAKKYTHHNFIEYLASQFLVLYGLLAYDDYNFFSALRALGLMGGELLESKYVPSL